MASTQYEAALTEWENGKCKHSEFTTTDWAQPYQQHCHWIELWCEKHPAEWSDLSARIGSEVV